MPISTVSQFKSVAWIFPLLGFSVQVALTDHTSEADVQRVLP